MILTSNGFRSLLAAIALAISSAAFGQGTDNEPNNSCLAAQDVGMPNLPYWISGNLESTVDFPDIDFFRFSGTPGLTVAADHQGAANGRGTLADPLLGLFDSGCNLVAFNDETSTSDSRLLFEIPADGIYVLAATAYPDFQFTGGGRGTYTLTVDTSMAIDSIFGRLVNADDGSPIAAGPPNFAWTALFRCEQDSCFQFVGSQSPDVDGTFRFDSDFNGNPLQAGSYQLYAQASFFEFFVSEIFDVAQGEMRDLGDVALTPLRFIGSVSGRIRDSISNDPLPGFDPPYAVAILERCEDDGSCVGWVGAPTDIQGRFHFDGMQYWLTPGEYRVTAIAEDYHQKSSRIFTVGENEIHNFGGIKIRPLPIQFGTVTGCEVPPGGGVCEYSIQLHNRTNRRMQVSAWSTIDYFNNSPPYRGTRFQVGEFGALFPSTQDITLRPGKSKRAKFQLLIPGDLPEGSNICATATVGTGDQPHFNNQGDRFIFCAWIQGGNVQFNSKLEGRNRLKELRDRSAQSEARMPTRSGFDTSRGQHRRQ